MTAGKKRPAREEATTTRGRRIEPFVSYLRVSTNRQGVSGLGLEAQREMIATFLDGGRGSVAEFVEVESGRRSDNRPRLAEALAECRRRKATLIVAKLDRLARDTHFVTGLQKAGVKFVVAEMPEATELTISIIAAVAQNESKMISERTKAAMAVARRRGARFGGDRGNLQRDHVAGAKASRLARRRRLLARVEDLSSTILPMRAGGASLREIADELGRLGYHAPRGGDWTPTGVRRMLLLLDDGRGPQGGS